MRMANERDQAIVRAAVSDAAASLLAFLPSLGPREVFAFGEGVPLPTRLRFRELPDESIPRGESVGHGRMDAGQKMDEAFIASVIERWRGAMISNRGMTEEMGEFETLATDEFSPLQSALARKSTPLARVAEPASYFFPVDPPTAPTISLVAFFTAMSRVSPVCTAACMCR